MPNQYVAKSRRLRSTIYSSRIENQGVEKWWISIADSDVMLFAKGLAIGKKLEVSISEPDVNIMAVQGPKAFNLLEKIFGKEILDLKFYNFKYFNFQSTQHLIARSGWSKQGKLV